MLIHYPHNIIQIKKPKGEIHPKILDFCKNFAKIWFFSIFYQFGDKSLT
jgi:hypothetical protein